MPVEEKRINEIRTSKLSNNPVKHHEGFQRTDKSYRNVNQRTQTNKIIEYLYSENYSKLSNRF